MILLNKTTHYHTHTSSHAHTHQYCTHTTPTTSHTEISSRPAATVGHSQQRGLLHVKMCAHHTHTHKQTNKHTLISLCVCLTHKWMPVHYTTLSKKKKRKKGGRDKELSGKILLFFTVSQNPSMSISSSESSDDALCTLMTCSFLKSSLDPKIVDNPEPLP